MSEQESNTSSDSLLKKVWYIFFILLYPILITFSLVFTGILLVFSGISKIIFKLIHLFSAKPDSVKNTSNTEPVIHPSSVNS